MTEAETVNWGLTQFVVSAKFADCCDKGEVDFNIFKPKRLVSIPGNESIEVSEWDAFDQTALTIAARNQLMTSMAACSIAVDEALTSRHGKSSFGGWNNDRSDLNALREIIFLIRSAYAHKMPDVHWYIRGPRTAAIYTVNTSDGVVTFDANGKHNTKLFFAHFGELTGFLRLVNFAYDLLK